jgi:NADP-dependent 3-hydroxy acid dehydrogenase YdfG
MLGAMNQGLVVAIAGASSGAGRAMALHLASLGYPVAVGARREGPLEELAAEIRGKGGRALAVRADMAVWSEAEGFVQRVVREYGRIDVLVNNAGWGVRAAEFADLSLEEIRQGVDVNLYTVLYGCRAALPYMKKQRAGHLINVSSILGKRGRMNLAVYTACKHAVEGFSRALLNEVNAHGIKVSVLAPGAIRTEWAAKAGVQIDPKLKLLSAEDIALVVQYLIETPRHFSIWNMDLMALEQTFNPL